MHHSLLRFFASRRLRLLVLSALFPLICQAQTPTFGTATLYSAGGGIRPYNITVADLNNDGKPDLISTSQYTVASVYLSNGNGTFQAGVGYNTGGLTFGGLAVGDINSDGKVDILAANNDGGSANNQVSIFLGNGNGTFQTPTILVVSTYHALISMAVADLNNDAKLDMVLTSQNSPLAVMLGNGNGTFQPATTYTLSTNDSGISSIADVNADSKPDLLIVNAGNVGVLINNGNGTFQAVVNYPSGIGSDTPYAVVATDINRDGKVDLLAANTAVYPTNPVVNTVSVRLGNGNGTFQAVANINVSATQSGFAVSDVNGDGKLDLVTANANANVVNVLPGNGNGTFQSLLTYPTGTGTNPSDIAVADVNADNKVDLITTMPGAYAVGILLNTTTFLPTRAALPGTSATLYPNPARSSATLSATGLPAEVRTVEATLLNPIGQVVRRLTAPTALGAAQANVPTAGLAPGLYLLRLSALDAREAVLGELPIQQLSVE